METPTTSGPQPTGTAEVHTRVEVEAEPGGTATSGGAGGTGGQAQSAMNQAKGKMGEAKGRAGEMASQAKKKASQALDQAESKIKQKTGVVSKARQNPLAAMGIAFGVGFLLAGSGDEEEHHRQERQQQERQQRGRRRKRKGGMMKSAKNQITGAIVGGLSTAITQEVRSFVKQQGGGDGLGGLLDSFMGKKSGGQQPSGGASTQGTTGRGFQADASTAGTTSGSGLH
jgi:ElaB/YqjD/DUF883 family membrane-anchored ribosome-binding protein